MTLRIRLLAAAALALPATMATAQQPGTTAPPPPAGTPALSTVQQPAAPPAPAGPTDTAAAVAEQAADAVEADAVAQTRVQAAAQGQAATAPIPPPAAPTPVQAQAQPPAPPAAAPGPVSLATAADLRTGVQVRDQSGGLVGTIETTDAGGAVVNTGTARARLALASFGRNNQGLVIGLTKVQLEAAATAANPG